jgi:peroxiredoxin
MGVSKQHRNIRAARYGWAAVIVATSMLGANSAAQAEFKVGAELPDFSLKTSDGAAFSLQRKEGQMLITQGTKQLEPKVLVLHLFQPDCLQCQAQMQELEKVYGDLAKDGLVVVGVAHKGNAEAAVAILRQLKLTFPVVLGTGSDLAKQFAAGDSLAIADRAGVVRFAQVGYGAGDEKVWRENIKRLLAGKPVTQETIARKRLQVGDRLPVIELPSVTTGKTISLSGEGGRLTFRDEEGKVSHPKAAVGFFSRY